MADPIKEFIEQLARMVIPGDDDPEMKRRVRAAEAEVGSGRTDTPESVVLSAAGDDFLTSEAAALWAMVRKARTLKPADILIVAYTDDQGPYAAAFRGLLEAKAFAESVKDEGEAPPPVIVTFIDEHVPRAPREVVLRDEPDAGVQRAPVVLVPKLYDESLVTTSMCVWEAMMEARGAVRSREDAGIPDQGEGSDPTPNMVAMDEYWENTGAVSMRGEAIRISEWIEGLFIPEARAGADMNDPMNALCDMWSFDWEVVPVIIREIVQWDPVHGPTMPKETGAQIAATVERRIGRNRREQPNDRPPDLTEVPKDAFTICFDTLCEGWQPITEDNNKPTTFATEAEAQAEIDSDPEFFDDCFVCRVEEIGRKAIFK